MRATSRLIFLSIWLSIGLVSCGPVIDYEQPTIQDYLPMPSSLLALSVQPSIVGEGSMEYLSEGIDLNLDSGSMFFVVFTETAVKAGDEITVSFSASSESESEGRFILHRHCDSANGEDFSLVDLKLRVTNQPVSVTHTFLSSYQCIRVSVLAANGEEAHFYLTNFEIRKAA